MPEPNVHSEYQRALLAARQRGSVLAQATEERLYRALEQAIRALTKDADEGRITTARAAALREQLRGLLDEFQREFAQAAGEAVNLTANDVTRIHRAVNARLFEQAGLELSAPILKRFDLVPTQAVAAIMARHENARTFRTVARRKLEAVVPEIDAVIDAGVARGVSAGQLTMDIADVLANGDESILARLPRGLSSRLHRGVGQIDLSRYGLRSSEVKEARVLLYDARRIAVSESNNTLREANTRSLVVSPLIVGTKWQTSGRHHHTDECDVLAGLDLHGYGNGVFPVDRWPLAPHPFCACTQGAPIMSRPLREWNQPKPPGRPIQIDVRSEGMYPDKWVEEWSERRFERVRMNVMALVGLPG